MSPVRATLLQSPGWNEGKARYETLGTHRQKQIELRRSGTYPRKQMPQRINILRRKTTNRNDTNQMRAVSAAPHRGSKYVLTYRTQGLRPGLCRSIAPLGLIARPHQSPPHHNPYNHNQTKTRTNATIHLHTQTHLTNTIPRHNTANAQYDNEPCKGDTPAKPRVE